MPVSSTVRKMFAVVVTLGTLFVPSIAAACPPAWTVVPSPAFGTGEDQLNDVVVVSETDAWASGDTDAGGVVLHWNGTAWSTVLGPVASENFYGIDAFGAHVWVVGERQTSASPTFKTRVRHWNGSAWSGMPGVPSPGDDSNRLQAVKAFGTDDIYAVGFRDDAGSFAEGLIVHWNGTSWSDVSLPATLSGTFSALNDVGGDYAFDLWSVGSFFDTALDHEDPLALQSSAGTTWNKVASPGPSPDRNVFEALNAQSLTRVWAVGWKEDLARETLIQRFNGSEWTVIPSPNMGTSSLLSGVDDIARANVWAVGNFNNAAGVRTLVERWNGSSWKVFGSPNLPTDYELFYDVAATPEGNLWAVGSEASATRTLVERLCPVRVADGGFSSPLETVPQGSDVAWSFPAANAAPRSIGDPSGMGLFSSGPVNPGSSFAFRFIAAGKYLVRDNGSGNLSTIAVPLVTAPRPTGGHRITWSAAAPPPDFGFDVQYRRVGTTGWTPWRTNTTSQAGALTGLASGTYQVRARMTHMAMHSSKWSPLATVVFP